MRSFLFFVLFWPVLTLSQVNDSFTDTNFTSIPTWNGDNADFIVNTSLQLQLNSTGTDTSILYTTNNHSLNNSEWRFWTKLSFSPSDNNFARIYLVADQTNLKGVINGYFIRMGENGSFDSVDLWKQSGSVETKIIDGVNGHCAKSSNTLSIKVIRDSIGNWNLYADTLGGTNFLLEGSVNDVTHTSTNYLGVYCKYTSSNATKFYFDDFYMGPIIIDYTAPIIDSLKILSANQLDIFFNEPVEQATAETISNYTVNNGIGNPINATRDATRLHLVHLSFSTGLTSGTYNILTTTNVKDLSSNSIVSIADTFLYYIAKPYDIVINEIMADPDPSIGLPNYEYLELVNTSTFPIKFEGWSITAGTTTKTIPFFTLHPDSFLILTSTTGASAFSSSVKVIGVTSFPALTNTGQTLVLRSAEGTVISTVTYSDSWYKDVNKEEGGWSLEQIDPDNPCGGDNNWKASLNLSGGTPGKNNSVDAPNADNTSPALLHASVISSDTIQLFFNEPLDSSTLMNTTTYIIDQGIGNPVSIDPIGPDYSKIKLSLSSALQQGIIYKITVNIPLSDCKGTLINTENSARFAIPEAATDMDLVINEVLYDPKTDGVDFVEIYNRSQKIMDLKNIHLSSMDTLTGALTEIKNLSADGHLIFPGEYKVLSTSGTIVKTHYSTASGNAFINLVSFPVMSNEGDVVVLSDATGTLIDKFIYSPDMHFALLNETKGISLERIDFNRSTNDKTNWHSAASTAGYATPGYENSQYAIASDNASLSIQPEIFSPDNDGYNDVVNIGYSLEEPGFVGNITIFDSQGTIIKYLVRNELLGRNGTFSWDGINENKEKSAIGIYIVYFEGFHSNGSVVKVKKTCVLAGKIR